LIMAKYKKKSNITTIKGRFDQLDTDRKAHLTRARRCAELTIPSLLPPENYNDGDSLPTPYQSLGARCVNHLASKLLLILLPPNTPFFKYSAPPAMVDQIVKESGEEAFKTEVEQKLRIIEQDIVDYIESEGHRSAFYKMDRLLLTTGNILLEMPKEAGLKVHRLDKYVTRRDPAGKPIEIVLREYIDKIQVPDYIQQEKNISASTENPKKQIGLYTHSVLKEDGKWHVRQEIFDQEVKESKGTYTPEDHPFLALSLNQVEGENYGRGHVEEYLGDFISLEALMQSVVEAAAAAARVVFLVRPGGTTDFKQVRTARNLAAIPGRRDDVETLQIDKHADFKIAYDTIGKLEDRLGRAFLLNDSVQRQAERVTATEVQYMAQQLENAMGGVYTTLSQDLQRPYLIKIVNQMKLKNLFNNSLPDVLKLTITTGYEALGRSSEVSKLDALMDRLQKFLPGEMLMQILDQQAIKVIIDKYATAMGVDTQGWVPSKEKIAAKEQQAQQQQMMQQLMDNPAIQDMMKSGGAAGGIPQQQGVKQ